MPWSRQEAKRKTREETGAEPLRNNTVELDRLASRSCLVGLKKGVGGLGFHSAPVRSEGPAGTGTAGGWSQRLVLVVPSPLCDPGQIT